MKAAAHPLRILVVDDDPLMRRILREMLQNADIPAEVAEADRAEAAAEKLRRGTFDCILLDFLMPGANGEEFLRALHQVGNRTPVVALTAQGDEMLAVAMMKAGAVDYLSKRGLTRQQLLAAVEGAVRKTRVHAAGHNLDLKPGDA